MDVFTSYMEAPLLFLGVQQLDVHVLRAVRAGHLPRHPRDEAVLLRGLVHPVGKRLRDIFEASSVNHILLKSLQKVA